MEPPTTREIKLNNNGSAKANLGPGGLRGVFQNNNGNWILRYYHHISHTSPTMAELLVLRCGLVVAKKHNITSFDIEMDSVVAFNILTHDHPLYFNILFECRTLIGELGATKPMKIYRE